MDVEIAKPDAHKRTYAFLELDNGLRAVVGSDSDCDKAGAALCVNVGMCHERKDMPGLAHFLEHMLFTGTKKYPKEGEYHEFIQQNGGTSNAYTTCFFTNFMFDVKPDLLPEALDRFSRFFSEPTLTRDCTDREINAVDSEHHGGATQPWWRYVGVINMSANPEHPFHVACGNVKVLRDEPKERGVDLYDEMVKLYNATYSSNGMTLCIIGKESVEELKALVREKFAAVANKGHTMPIGDDMCEKPPFLPKDWNRFLLQNPVKDVKDLAFSWVIPYQKPLWKTKPTQYVSHLLGYEGAGSVIAELKKQGLISGCTCGGGQWLEGAFSLLNVIFELTEKGLSKVKEIGEHLFAFLGMLRKVPVEAWIVEEMMRLRRIQFKFASDTNAYSLCSRLSASLQHLPPSEALAGDVLIYDYDAEAISSVISKLTLEGVRVSQLAKCLAERCTEKDSSYDSPMAFEAIDEEWLRAWRSAMDPGDGSAEASVKAAADLGLHLPKPNPFIPEDLSLRELPAEQPKFPENVPEAAAPPVARVFHKQDSVFKQPKAHVSFHIFSPFAVQDVESFAKTELWCRVVEEELNEFAYDATVAGVSYALGMRAGYLALSVAGFNDKLGVLLAAVTEKMRTLAEVPESTWGIVADSYGDEIRNAAFYSQPYSQCTMRFNELASRGMTFPSYMRHKAFEALKREDLSSMAERLFEECHVEAMMMGNLDKEDAKALSSTLAKGLCFKRPMPSLPLREEATLPAGRTLWSLPATNEEDANHALFLRLQLPESLETDMNMCLLSKVLGPKFFDILRTQQQLGYVVQLANNSSSLFCYLIAVVQTEFPLDHVRGSVDAFLEEHFAFVLEKLTQEEFETCRKGLLSELRMKPKNLHEEVSRYSRGFTDRSRDFGRRQRAADFVEGQASLDGLRAFVKESLQPAPRLYTEVRKQSKKEDKPLPEGAQLPSVPEDVRRWDVGEEGHRHIVESFVATAAWRSLKSSLDS